MRRGHAVAPGVTKSERRTKMAEKWIYWLRELGTEHNDVVGKKCANLGELTKAGFHVPPGFALGVGAYERFMKETDVTDRLLAFLKTFKADPHNVSDTLKFEAASDELRKIAESTKMPPDMEQVVKDYYAELCGAAEKDDVFVATRSAGPTSHPGQYETYLNVSGADEVVRNVIRVWSSTFNTRSIIARARLGLPLHYDAIGVAVLTMVDAKAAGVIFTVNPVNGDESKVAIEASFGFGEEKWNTRNSRLTVESCPVSKTGKSSNSQKSPKRWRLILGVPKTSSIPSPEASSSPRAFSLFRPAPSLCGARRKKDPCSERRPDGSSSLRRRRPPSN
jgi:pyruvate,water dikinase